jgi:hypothetical protein
MSQTPRLRRARQLTASVLPARGADGYGNLVAARLRKIETAGGTGRLPFSGGADGAIYFRDGKVVYAESRRTPGPAADTYTTYTSDLPPLDRITAIRAITEPIVDAVLELLSAQARHAKFRSARLAATGLASGIGIYPLLAEVNRRQRLLKQISGVLTADTALARNPHLRSESIRITAWQWALLIRVRHGSTPRDLAWDLGRSVFGTTTEIYRLIALRLLSVAGHPARAGGNLSGEIPGPGPANLSFVRAVPVKKGGTMPLINAGTTAGETG